MPACFVPEREFDPIPDSKFVVDDTQIVFYNILGGTHDLRDFTVLESLSDQSNYSLLSFARNPFSVAVWS